MDTDNNQELTPNTDKPALSHNVASLNPQQLGAYITNSGIRPLASVDPQVVLDRYERGERIDKIAQELGCTNKAIYRMLLRKAPEAWVDYQAAHVLNEHLEWVERINSAPDALELARAREGVKASQWQLERLCRRLYGDTQVERGGSGTININIGIERNAQVTIDHESE